MKINKELIRHVAKTARLNLTESEIKEFLPQLKEILEAFAKIQEVNTKNTKPSYHPIELKNRMREDIPRKSSITINNSKHTKDNYIKGPRIV